MAKTDNLTDFLTNTANAIRTAEGSTDAINPQDFEAKITALKLSVQTADADATAEDILFGKTAYVNGVKLTGTFSSSGYPLGGEWTIDQNKLDAVMDSVPEQLLDFKFGIDNPSAGFTSYTGIKSRAEINSAGTYYGTYILQFKDTSGNYIDVYSMEVGSSGNWVGSFYKGNFRFETQQLVSEQFYNWFTSFATLSSGTSNTNTTTLTVTPNETIQTFNASDEGYVGYSEVTVNAIPEGYIQPSGTKMITENGTHDVTNYASAMVSISSGSYKGEWAAGTTYNTDDIVTYQGNVYRCKYDSITDTTPGSDGGMVWEQLNTSTGDSGSGGGSSGGSSETSLVTLSGTYTLNSTSGSNSNYAVHPYTYDITEYVSGSVHSTTFSFIRVSGYGGNNCPEMPITTIYFLDGNKEILYQYTSDAFAMVNVSFSVSSDTQVSSLFYSVLTGMME